MAKYNWAIVDSISNWAANFMHRNFKGNYNGVDSYRNPNVNYYDLNKIQNSPFKDLYDKYYEKAYTYDVFLQDVLHPEIMFTIDYISKKVASLELESFTDKYTNVRGGNKALLFAWNHKPNKYQNDNEFKYQLVFRMYMQGSVYVIPWRNEKNDIEFHIVPNEIMFRVRDKASGGKYVYIGNPNQITALNDNYIFDNEECYIDDYLDFLDGQWFKEEDLLNFKLFNYDNCGHSPLEYLWKDLGNLAETKLALSQNLESSTAIQGAVFGNVVGGGVAYEKKGNKTIDELMKSNESGVVTIGGQNASMQTWNKPNNLSAISPAQKELRKKLYNYLGVPDGLLDGDSNQGKKELVELFYNKTLGDLLSLIESEIELKQTSMSFLLDDGALRFDIKKIFRTDYYSLSDTKVKEINAGIITANDARIALGMERSNDPYADMLNPKQVFNLNNKMEQGVKENGTKENADTSNQ